MSERMTDEEIDALQLQALQNSGLGSIATTTLFTEARRAREAEAALDREMRFLKDYPCEADECSICFGDIADSETALWCNTCHHIAVSSALRAGEASDRERDALRSQLEEALFEATRWCGAAETWEGLHASLRSELQAARERIGRLEDALRGLVGFGPPTKGDASWELAVAALAPEPADVPTREVLTPEQAAEMRKEGAALSEEIERRTAPMKRGPFKPEPRRVDPFDMPGKGGGT